MKTATFLQSRLDSTRLPAKALYDLDGKPLVARCMEALSALKTDVHVLVCDEDSLPAFKSLARREGWEIYGGSKNDVLGRFTGAARHFGIDLICRGTGDNPLVSAALSNLLLEHILKAGADYALFADTAIGGCVECVRSQALYDLETHGPGLEEREHVCPGIYRRPEKFKLSYPDAPDWAGRKPERYSIDTLEDYLFIQSIYDSFPSMRPLILEKVRPLWPFGQPVGRAG